MSDYWKNREQTQRAKDVMDEMRYNAELKRMYLTMMDECQDEIDRFYGKYATDEGITLADAKKRVEQMDIEAYERMAKKMVAEKDFSKEANEAMRLYNTTMKINRLEYLKSKIGLNLVDGYDDLQKYFEKKITSRTVKEFERMAGILGDTVTATDVKRRAEAILNSSFYNAKFSDRIWSNQDMLRNEIDRQLQSGMIRGASSRELAQNIASAFNVSLADAQRLMATEMRRAQTEAAKIAYEESGVIEYQYIVTNYKACPVCKEMDGKVFLVSKMEPGENAPPLHPRCHCTTGPYGDDDEYNDWLNALESGKTTEQWRQEHPYNKLFGDYESYDASKWLKKKAASIMDGFEAHKALNIMDYDGEYSGNIKNVVDNMPESHRRIFDRYKEGVNLKHENARITKSTPDGIYVNLKDAMSDKRGMLVPLFHEIGHAIDAAMGRPSLNSSFKAAIERDYENGVRLYMKQFGVSREEAYIGMSEYMNKQSDAIHGVSDIYGGLSGHKVVGPYGHEDPKYWEQEGNIQKEMFAHFFEATSRNDVEAIEIYERFFPEAYDLYKKMMGA